MYRYTVYKFKLSIKEHSKTWKTNNNGIWVKGDDDFDHFDIIQEILEIEYAGWLIKKQYAFGVSGLIQAQEEQEYLRSITSLKLSTVGCILFMIFFILAQNIKKVYYAPYPLHRNKSDWWAIIKMKPIGWVKV